MLHITLEAGLPVNGTPRNFDLLKGRRDTGDLTATLIRNPVNIDPQKNFDWTLTLSVNGGGLIAMKDLWGSGPFKPNDLYPYEAPTSGYQTITINMPAASKNWADGFDFRSYYFYDGQHYGRVTISVQPDYPPPMTHASFDAYVNPSGSRNLEFDETKQINQ